MSLKRFTPERVLELYLTDKGSGLTGILLSGHMYQLGHFAHATQRQLYTQREHVSQRVIEQHYDRRMEREKMELQKVSRQHLTFQFGFE